MATSGSTDFEQTRDELIVDALRKINVIDSSESIASSDLTLCVRQLNRMVKTWQMDGIYSWNQYEGVLFLNAEQNKYSLGVSGDRSCLLDDFVSTTLSAAAVDTATTLYVTDTSDIAVSDYIGIELDDGTRHWTTVSSKTSTTVVIASAITDDAASANTIYAYTTVLPRPLEILTIRREGSDGIELDLGEPLSRQEYQEQPQKTTAGTPIVAFYSRNAKSTGTLYLWPTPNECVTKVKFTYLKALEDFDSSANNPDFPVEWYDALVYNLAVRVAPDFGVKLGDIQDVAGQADYFYQQVKKQTREWAPIRFQPMEPY